MKYSYMYVYTRMIFTAVLSPAIKIFHRHLGPNLLIFAVKVSPTFYRDFMTSPTFYRDFMTSPTFHREKTPTKVISCLNVLCVL